MATSANSPVEVGARGTILSLVLQEIEYFRKLDLGSPQSSGNAKVRVADGGAGSRSSNRDYSRKPSFRNSPTGRRRKKKNRSAGGSGGLFLPGICSAAEIAEEQEHVDRINPRIGYTILEREQS